MTERYSIVIHPQNPFIEMFKILKNQLQHKIGRNASCGSAAHITILEFEAKEKELPFIIEKLITIVKTEVSFDAVFDKIIYSELSNTIFALPDKDGNELFKPLLKRIRKKINGENKKSGAHVSIGRELTKEQLEKSKDLFPDARFDFHCNRIALRKLNKNIGQFEIIQTFTFSGKPATTQVVQLSLF